MTKESEENENSGLFRDYLYPLGIADIGRMDVPADFFEQSGNAERYSELVHRLYTQLRLSLSFSRAIYGEEITPFHQRTGRLSYTFVQEHPHTDAVYLPSDRFNPAEKHVFVTPSVINGFQQLDEWVAAGDELYTATTDILCPGTYQINAPAGVGCLGIPDEGTSQYEVAHYGMANQDFIGEGLVQLYLQAHARRRVRMPVESTDYKIFIRNADTFIFLGLPGRAPDTYQWCIEDQGKEFYLGLIREGLTNHQMLKVISDLRNSTTPRLLDDITDQNDPFAKAQKVFRDMVTAGILVIDPSEDYWIPVDRIVQFPVYYGVGLVERDEKKYHAVFMPTMVVTRNEDDTIQLGVRRNNPGEVVRGYIIHEGEEVPFIPEVGESFFEPRIPVLLLPEFIELPDGKRVPLADYPVHLGTVIFKGFNDRQSWNHVVDVSPVEDAGVPDFTPLQR